MAGAMGVLGRLSFFCCPKWQEDPFLAGVQILPEGVLDLSSLRSHWSVGDAFVFFARQFLKASPQLVIGILNAQYQPHSTQLQVTVVCDGLVHATTMTFKIPVDAPFVTAEHCYGLYDAAQKWVDGLPALLFKQSKMQPNRFLGDMPPPDVLKEIDHAFAALAGKQAAAIKARAEAKAGEAEAPAPEPVG